MHIPIESYAGRLCLPLNLHLEKMYWLCVPYSSHWRIIWRNRMLHTPSFSTFRKCTEIAHGRKTVYNLTSNARSSVILLAIYHRKMSFITHASHTGLITRIRTQLFICTSQWYPLCEYHPNAHTLFLFECRVYAIWIYNWWISDGSVHQQIDGQSMVLDNMRIRRYASG